MTDLTIFANFYIDTEERFLRMKDSFLSFYKIEASQWIVNIRGRYREAASSFLKEYLGSNLSISFLNSKNGWFYDTKQLLSKIKSNYIFIWLEDHINIAPISYFEDVLTDIKDNAIEMFYYTFFEIDNRFDGVKMASTNNIRYFLFDEHNHSIMKKNIPLVYIIWYPVIMTTVLFKRIIENPPDESKRKWPIETPFDFEKDVTETQWLPIKTGIPQKEIFVSIDDDRKNGYSLQSRGLYPKREERKSYTKIENNEEIIMNNTEVFHHYNEDHNTKSANVLIPYLLNYIMPQSVIDIGCGLGQWLYVFNKVGINDILGIDGGHVPKDQRKINQFYEFDLRNINKNTLKQDKFNRKYDLGVSLEVAEHLPENLADNFINLLTGLSDYVLFSAALPFQTGENHINEQYHDYWIKKFNDRDYICYDIFRKRFWNNDSVNWWYRQNLYLFGKKGAPLKIQAEIYDGNCYIHPKMLSIYTSRIKVEAKAKADKTEQSYHQKNRNINTILQDLISRGVTIEEKSIDVNDFDAWLENYSEVKTRYQNSGDVFIEKCLEHYIANKLTDIKKDDVYIDIASAGSNYSDILQKRGVNAYKLDLSFPAGVRGNEIGGDAGATKLDDCSVDSMSLQCAFECFEGDSDIRFIKEAQRILKKGGKLVISPLYIDNEFINITSRACNQDEITFDDNALKVWRDDQYKAPFSRHYSPAALLSRILKNVSDNNSYKIFHVNNLDELKTKYPGQRIYCDLVFYLEKKKDNKIAQNIKPILTVIIPTRNRGNILKTTLESICNQNLSPDLYEILVIDNGSTDSTKDVYLDYKQKIKNIKYFYIQEPGLHNGRHKGMIESKTDILVFCDDDIEASSTWLEGIYESFSDQSVALVGGKNLPKVELAMPEWIEKMWNVSKPLGKSLAYLSISDLGDETKGIDPNYVWGLNFSIRKSVLLEAGGFHPDGMPQELIKYRGDGETSVTEYIKEHGYKTIYNPKALVYHVIPKERLTLDYFKKRAYNQGISDSFSYIRKNRNFTSKAIAEVKSGSLYEIEIAKSYSQGFNYHQESVQTDKTLFEWVLMPFYYSFD